MLDPITASSTVAQLDVLLHLTQGETFEVINDNTALSASLWINVALAGLSILLFVLMGRNLEDTRAKFIWVATLLVPLVSISSYAALVSGLTVTFVQMPEGHALANQWVFSPWGRYLTWTLSTPMILAALGLLADTDRTTLFTAITMDIGMCVTGLAAAFTTSSYLLRWVFFGISTAFFLVVVYVLLVEWPADAKAAGTEDIFNLLKSLTVVLWFGYPILWAFGTEGLAVLSLEATSWGYSVLDIFAKYVFAFLLLRWVAANEGVVGRASNLIGSDTAASTTPADD